MAMLAGVFPQELTLDLVFQETVSGHVKLEFSRVRSLREEVCLRFSARNVKTSEWFSRTDPFLRIFRPSAAFLKEADAKRIPEKQWVLVEETAHVHNSLNPDFEELRVRGPKLCLGYLQARLKLEI